MSLSSLSTGLCVRRSPVEFVLASTKNELSRPRIRIRITGRVEERSRPPARPIKNTCPPVKGCDL